MFEMNLKPDWFKLSVTIQAMNQANAASNVHTIYAMYTLRGINISHTLGKGKSSSKCHFWGDMLVPSRVYLVFFHPLPLQTRQKHSP